MNVSEFVGVDRTGDLTWQLPISRRVSTQHGFLFGGCGLAASLIALEEETARPTIWASAQFLNYASSGSVLDLKVDLVVTGRRVSQANVTGSVEGRRILSVSAALGNNELDLGGVWASPPKVPGPEQCPLRWPVNEVQSSIFDLIEMRIASAKGLGMIDDTPGDRRPALWCRIRESEGPCAATLAVIADLLAGGVEPENRQLIGSSLDNTLRVVQLEPTTWVLCEMKMYAMVGGFAHGVAFLWSESGTLLATASQSIMAKRILG